MNDNSEQQMPYLPQERSLMISSRSANCVLELIVATGMLAAFSAST